ncbi:MAG: FUN14 domain-containing protein, partial [Planctomycetota bacterium]
LVGTEAETSESAARGKRSELASTSFVDGTTAPTSGGSGSAESSDSDGAWSPALIRGGISFFAAFCLAFAFRTFLRLALVFIGIWAASLFFLDHLGWIEVHWTVIDQAFRDMTANIGRQFESVRTLVTGSLPSAGLAGLGLFTGFKKG